MEVFVIGVVKKVVQPKEVFVFSKQNKEGKLCTSIKFRKNIRINNFKEIKGMEGKSKSLASKLKFLMSIGLLKICIYRILVNFPKFYFILILLKIITFQCFLHNVLK